MASQICILRISRWLNSRYVPNRRCFIVCISVREMPGRNGMVAERRAANVHRHIKIRVESVTQTAVARYLLRPAAQLHCELKAVFFKRTHIIRLVYATRRQTICLIIKNIRMERVNCSPYFCAFFADLLGFKKACVLIARALFTSALTVANGLLHVPSNYECKLGNWNEIETKLITLIISSMMRRERGF